MPTGWRGAVVAVVAAVLIFQTVPAPAASPWKTMTGDEPKVIARGGLSGVFPSSSYLAYAVGNMTSMAGTLSWCDLQLTNDGVGVCLPSLFLDNCTDVSLRTNPPPKSTYPVRGRNVTAWFAADYTFQQLYDNFLLIQPNNFRTASFDGLDKILSVEDVQSLTHTLWLNIDNYIFYEDNGLNMTELLRSYMKANLSIAYISSSEIGFLQKIKPLVNNSPSTTKLVFNIPDGNSVEPSTNRSYETLLRNLTFVSTFASGIVVPKGYVWPVTAERFLQPHTSVVSAARAAELEVFGSGFANDFLFAYNHSYDPVFEYLSFLDNGDFSLDGLVTDFPSTASEAVRCFSHLNDSRTEQKPLVISHNGASGDFPACTDLAYKRAVESGADLIDCSVQVTKDAILVCLTSIDLTLSTSVSQSTFSDRLSTFTDIQTNPGIFTFNFTWEEIQTLKPQIWSPLYKDYKLARNPSNANAGSFMRLQDFLEFAKGKDLKGVVIKLENARFVVERLGFDLVGSVLAEMSEAAYGDELLEVMIQSSRRSTLIPFRDGKRKIIYTLDEVVGDVEADALRDVASFADAVAVMKEAIFPTTRQFVASKTKLVERIKSANLSVYAYVLVNEFVAIPWDFLSDPYVEMHNLVAGAEVDGVITDFPATAQMYRKGKGCKDGSFGIPLIEPRFLLESMNGSRSMPPELPPLPPLKAVDVAEPPLASVRSPALAPSAANHAQGRWRPSTLCWVMILAMVVCM